MHLYQHSPRCSIIMQHFLDNNPEYWCLVPMSSEEARQDNKLNPITASSDVAHLSVTGSNRMPFESPTFAPAKSQLFEEVLRNTMRSREECIWLAKGLPKTPTGFRFSRRQIDEQLDFFKFKKDTRILSRHLIDCYKYTIIAVLPDECSYELRRFLESLFITHCETKLNTTGNLTRRTSMSSTSAIIATTTTYDHTIRGHWCDKLLRRTTHTRRF